ncbi:MAG: hypothetical protein PVG07_01715 [Acidobacteriota bacterium]|jgi:hypothetical protein
MGVGLPPISFDPEVEISPYELFRRLREGRAPALYALASRPEPEPERPRRTLRGAGAVTGPDWAPPEDEAVIFDEDGEGARALVTALRERGISGVRALFGGLRLYDYCLDPRVVGEERYLVDAAG